MQLRALLFILNRRDLAEEATIQTPAWPWAHSLPPPNRSCWERIGPGVQGCRPGKRGSQAYTYHSTKTSKDAQATFPRYKDSGSRQIQGHTVSPNRKEADPGSTGAKSLRKQCLPEKHGLILRAELG